MRSEHILCTGPRFAWQLPTYLRLNWLPDNGFHCPWPHIIAVLQLSGCLHVVLTELMEILPFQGTPGMIRVWWIRYLVVSDLKFLFLLRSQGWRLKGVQNRGRQQVHNLVLWHLWFRGWPYPSALWSVSRLWLSCPSARLFPGGVEGE